MNLRRRLKRNQIRRRDNSAGGSLPSSLTSSTSDSSSVGANHDVKPPVFKAVTRVIAVNLALILAVSLFSARQYIAAPLAYVSNRFGAVAAAAVLPEGALPIGENSAAESAERSEICQPEPSGANSSAGAENGKNAADEKTRPTAAKITQKPQPTTLAMPVAGEIKGKISTETIGYSGASAAIDHLHVANHTGLKIDLKKQLAIAPAIKISKTNGPKVLIIHTHATESYYDKPAAAYSEKWAVKSRDNNKNMIRVGNEFADELNKAGIETLHDTTQYDKDEYSGSYERARVKTKEYLKKYPSIAVVIDLHRDSITYDSGTKVRPVTTIDGKTAAQIMICTGSNTGRVSGYDNWESNFRFAIRLQQSCEKNYKNLARPLYFVSKKYNHDLCSGSLLIEVGSEANTLEEAKYAARLTAKAMAKVLAPLSE